MDGIIYILKFEPQFWHARYYVGWCHANRLYTRLKEHRTGQGAHITRAAVEQGHRLELVADFPGTRDDERAIKRRKNTPAFVKSLERRGLLNTQDRRVTERASNVTSPARNDGLTYYDDREDTMGRIDLSHINLIELVERDTGQRLKKEAQCSVGACPFCNEGNDRFVVWPAKFWCRRCNKSGDAINYLMYRREIDFKEACKELGVTLASNRPSSRTVNPALKRQNQPTHDNRIAPERESAAMIDPQWRDAAAEFAEECHQRLITSAPAALTYLLSRGLEIETIKDMCIGWHDKDRSLHWGKTKVFAPEGIVFPWYGNGQEITRVNFRPARGEHKYRLADGSAQEFYLGWRMVVDCRVVLVEGEIDALTIAQAYNWHPLVCPIATGSVTHGRVMRLIARLALAKSFRVAFDHDEAGTNARKFWLSIKEGAIALDTPLPHKDVNALYCAYLQDPENDGKTAPARDAVRAWVEGRKL